MAKIVINGPAKLFGSVSVRGAKNAALPIVLASMLGDSPVTVSNVPTCLNDIQAVLEALRFTGCETIVNQDIVKVHCPEVRTTSFPVEITGRFRNSLLFLGMLVGKCGHAKITLPGGCNIGSRKYDLHLEGLRRLGARVRQIDNFIEVDADKLVGTDIDFYLPTTTGTENIMLAACFAHGRTRILNANTRPEIVDFGNFLNTLGARITTRNRLVEIEGPVSFHGGEFSVMPGWDEALTYILAAAMTGSEVCVRNFSLETIQQDVAYLRQAGVDVFQWGGNVYASGRNRSLKAFDLFTAPYPGVNSDMQPLFAALASQCFGETTITDQRFTERFAYVTELRKFGIPIDNYGNCAVITGSTPLQGAQVSALDLRCGAALVLSALTATGTTVIDNIYQIQRGYEFIDSRFQQLGADIHIDSEEVVD